MDVTEQLAPVTAIIVSYNTLGPLRQCLASIVPQVKEVIVVDNASRDGSVAMVSAEFPTVNLIASDKNLGFGAANNVGIRVAQNEVVLFLNSDAKAMPGAVAELLEVLVGEGVMATGGRLEFEDGTLQPSCCSSLTLGAVFREQFLLEGVLHRLKIGRPYWLSADLVAKGEGPFEVEQVMGACLMMRKGLEFDESYFLYCEDTELCRRIRKLGKILYVPKAKFVHELGASSTGNRWWSIAMYNRGKEHYFQQTGGSGARWICWLYNRKGAALRFLAWLILTPAFLTSGSKLRSHLGRLKMWINVMFCPISGPKLPVDARNPGAK